MAHTTRNRVRGVSFNVRYVQSEGRRADIDREEFVFTAAELKSTSMRTGELKTAVIYFEHVREEVKKNT